MNKLNIDWQNFLNTYWQKKPVILRKAFANFIDPITPDELAGLAMEPELDSRLVTNKQGKWEAKFGPFNDYSHLGETNWSLLVQAVDHWHQEAATIVEPFRCLPHWQFEDLMVSYATRDAGVGPHIDNYDVFIIQGMGSRRWRVGDRNNHYQQFNAHKALLHVKEFTPIIDEIMTAGDILYIPIGCPHDGISLGESLSYSVGFRSQSSQEMLSSFADYIIDNLPQGLFYQVPNLQLSQDPSQIDKIELAKLQQHMINLIQNPQLFNDWFGKHITIPMHELDIAIPDPSYEFNEFEQLFKAGGPLFKVPSIRIIKIENQGYINGELLAIDKPLVDILCANPAIKYNNSIDNKNLKELWKLVNQGFLYFNESD